MKGHISHLSAAIMWNIPYIETVIGNMISESENTDITVIGYNARFCINGKKSAQRNWLYRVNQ